MLDNNTKLKIRSNRSVKNQPIALRRVMMRELHCGVENGSGRWIINRGFQP